jgi:hypothetical protein
MSASNALPPEAATRAGNKPLTRRPPARVPREMTSVLFPVLVTPLSTDLVATLFFDLSSVFAIYNGSASWRTCNGDCTRPVRAS